MAPTYPEFDHIFAAQFKAKASAQKKLRTKLRTKQMNGERVPATVDAEEFEQEVVMPLPMVMEDNYDDDGGFGFDDDHGEVGR